MSSSSTSHLVCQCLIFLFVSFRPAVVKTKANNHSVVHSSSFASFAYCYCRSVVWPCCSEKLSTLPISLSHQSDQGQTYSASFQFYASFVQTVVWTFYLYILPNLCYHIYICTDHCVDVIFIYPAHFIVEIFTSSYEYYYRTPFQSNNLCLFYFIFLTVYVQCWVCMTFHPYP